MKTIVVTAVALALAVPTAGAATLCARNQRRPVLRPACRAGEHAVAGRLCTRKNGQLVLRAACRAGERPYDAGARAVVGPGGAPGTPGPAGEDARFPLRIVDATGQEVGEVDYFHPGSAHVRVQRGPLPGPVVILIGPEGPTRTIGGGDVVFYRSAGCAGVPYVRTGGRPREPAPVYGNVLYHAEGDTLSGVPMASYEFDTGTAPCPPGTTETPRATCCENEAATPNALRAAVPVPVEMLGLVPPFRAVAR